MDERPTHLDLFSGIGGFALAAQWTGFRTIGFCEIDKYCQKVLAKNFVGNAACGHSGNNERSIEASNGERWMSQPDRPSESPRLIPSIFDLDGREFYGVSLITGGFPCQPFSVAGKQRGAADDRHLWPEMLRVITQARPAWVLGENVPGIIPMELDNVLSDLESIGYATRAFVIPACAVDARHRRDRLWIVAQSIDHRHQSKKRSIIPETAGTSQPNGTQHSSARKSDGASRSRENQGLTPIGVLADSDGEHREELQRRNKLGEATRERTFGRSDEREGREWLSEPDVGRVAHGVPSRVDRLKGLGNAIVPQVAYEILLEIRNLIG